ncbi:MAG: hypothetical protein AAB303_04260 [Chloroflexota bacterium]
MNGVRTGLRRCGQLCDRYQLPVLPVCSGLRIRLKNHVQHHVVVPGVLVMAVLAPSGCLPVHLNVSQHRRRAFLLDHGVFEVRAWATVGTARVEHTETFPVQGTAGTAPLPLLPQADCQALGD